MKVEFYKHNIGQPEKQKILECLDGLFLTTGSYVKDFETEIARYLNLEHAVGLTSCTAALHLSLLALGIGPGDEVITTPMTFIATATAVMHTGARPIFVDVEPETGLIDPLKIESAVTPKTKAIIPVHLYGQMCDMRAIKEIAKRHDLSIVEDAAHCIEGERDGVRPGQIGDIACLSFYATKNITSGEGGAIVTNSGELAQKITMLRQHGMSREAADRYHGIYRHWDMLECGWKYNMDNVHASLLLPQIPNMDSVWKKRRELYDRYMEGIKAIPGIDFPRISPGSKSAFHLFTIWVDNEKRDYILQEFGRRDIGVAVNYRAIHLLKFFADTFGFKNGSFPEAEKIGRRTISLPFYPKLTRQEMSFVLDSLREIIDG